MKRIVNCWAVLVVLALFAVACSSADENDVSTASSTNSTSSTAAPETTQAETTQAPPTSPTTADPETTEAASEGTGGPGGCATVGVSSLDLVVDGEPRTVRVFVPSTWDGNERLPLVVDWHGLGSNGQDQALFSGYEQLAETEGFLVVHPSGVSGSGNRPNWELDQFPDPAKDDVAYADELLDVMIEDYCADAQRIYSTGMSNGGLFTSVLICNMADRLAAAASVAGVTHDDSCAPSRPVPYIAFHGTADAVVPFDGSSSAGALFSEVMPEEFGQFAADFKCDPEPVDVPVGDEVTRHDYVGCDNDTPMSFYEIAGGGHTWPNSPIAALVEGALGATTTEVDATADSWAFFQQHSLAD